MDAISFEILDLRYLKQAAGGEIAILRELLGLFRVDAARHLEGLQEAVGRGDWEMVRYEAHSLAGLCATTGASHLQSLVRRIEEALREGRQGEIPLFLPQIAVAWNEVEVALLAVG